jgi:amidophosphoribosyltransferase
MCAIAGAFNVPNASLVVRHMLFAMQHRGQDGAGIVSSHAGRLLPAVRGFGGVDHVFADIDFDTRLPGLTAIGHVRYPTSGDPKSEANLQPMEARRRSGDVAIVHNGNLTNARVRHHDLEEAGAIIRSTSDTELFLHFMARSGESDTANQLLAAGAKLEGAYATLTLTQEGIFAMTDPWGFRPLVMARCGDGYLFASEPIAFDVLDELELPEGTLPSITDVTTVPQGTIVRVTGGEAYVQTYMRPPLSRFCAFEHIYFAHPASTVFGQSVNAVRERLGKILGWRNTVKADLVTAVPDSSNAAAHAFAQAAGIPFRFAITRSHYTGRTFIKPGQKARQLGVRAKFQIVRELVKGKSVLIVDDSIVRGTTTQKLVKMLRRAGAREVHMAIVSPPVVHPCHWGIDTPERKELVASQIEQGALAAHLGLDTLTYLTHAELLEALEDPKQDRHCTTCFTRVKPIHCHKLPH